MKNIKFVIGFGICGFLLSFIAGLFSRSGIVHIILMAVIFAAIFAGLGFLIQFLMDGVLSIDGQPVSSAAEGTTEAAPKTGGVVDITVQDEDLPSEENSPQFFVGDKHQLLNKKDYSDAPQVSDGFSSRSDAPVPEVDTVQEMDTAAAENKITENITDSDANEGFVSVPLQESAKKISEIKTAEYDTSKPAADSADDILNLEDDTLDELPELKDLKTSTSDDDSFVEDSDFSRAGDNRKSDQVPEVKNAAIMAKAISTVLAKDKDI
jgi:hypothetical protein